MAEVEHPPESPAPKPSPPGAADISSRRASNPTRLGVWGGVVLLLLGIWFLSVGTADEGEEAIPTSDRGKVRELAPSRSMGSGPPPRLLEPLRRETAAAAFRQRVEGIRGLGTSEARGPMRPNLRHQSLPATMGRRLDVLLRSPDAGADAGK